MNLKNKLSKLPPYFQEFLNKVSELADSLGVDIYLIGGVVRDLIIGRKIIDLDIVIEGDAISFSQRIADLFGCQHKKYESFSTASVYFQNQKIDFATARTEEYLRGGNLPKVKPAGLKQDLMRRDFTINALAVSLNKDNYGAVTDVCGGIDDLNNKLLRIIHRKSFFDDPTRILRCVRFEKRFNFNIESNTLKCLKEAISGGALRTVSLQRLKNELLLVLEEDWPCRYIKRLSDLGIFTFFSANIQLNKEDFKFFRKIEKSTKYLRKKFPNRKIEDLSIVYLAGIFNHFSEEKTIEVIKEWGIDKKKRKMVILLKNRIKDGRQLVNCSNFWQTLFYAYPSEK